MSAQNTFLDNYDILDNDVLGDRIILDICKKLLKPFHIHVKQLYSTIWYENLTICYFFNNTNNIACYLTNSTYKRFCSIFAHEDHIKTILTIILKSATKFVDTKHNVYFDNPYLNKTLEQALIISDLVHESHEKLR